MNVVKRFFRNLHVYVLWLLASVFLWGWIFGFVTDTRPEKKVTLYVSAETVEDLALADALSSALPEGLRMVKVHPFSYAFFQGQDLTGADLYVVRESELEQYADSFRPLPIPAQTEVWMHDGAPCALRCWDAVAGRGAGADYIAYDAAEDAYLCFGAQSVHTDDGAQEAIARRFLELEGTK